VFPAESFVNESQLTESKVVLKIMESTPIEQQVLDTYAGKQLS
jgi:hypothetical protein